MANMITFEEQEEEVTSLVEVAKRYQIASLADVEVGAEMIRGMKDLQKEICAHHDPIKKAAHSTWKIACAAEKKLLDPIKKSIIWVRHEMTVFETARQREALLALREAKEEAQKKADDWEIPVEMVPITSTEGTADTKVEGVSYVSKFAWEFTGHMAAVNPGFVAIDEKAVNAVVRARGMDAERIVGGIRVTETKIPRVK